MDREKVLTLQDYFYREIKPLLNPGGRNRAASIASKISIDMPGSSADPDKLKSFIPQKRQRLKQRIEKYNDMELKTWYADMKALHEEDAEAEIEKVIEFYLKKYFLTKEEKEFYKISQYKNFRDEGNK